MLTSWDLTLLTPGQRWQALLDQSTPYVLYRWLSTSIFLVLFFIRIFVAQGWYIGTTTTSPHSHSHSHFPSLTQLPFPTLPAP